MGTDETNNADQPEIANTAYDLPSDFRFICRDNKLFTNICSQEGELEKRRRMRTPGPWLLQGVLDPAVGPVRDLLGRSVHFIDVASVKILNDVSPNLQSRRHETSVWKPQFTAEFHLEEKKSVTIDREDRYN